MTVCYNCPLRLFNKKGHNINGIGNIWSGNALVLPNVDKDAYKKQNMSFSNQVKVLQQILPTGGLELNLYITPLIRCNEHFDIEITPQIVSRCLTYFDSIVNVHKIENIMLCGDAARRFLNIDNLEPYLNTIICDRNSRRKYFVNYSPLVKDKYFDTFKKYLRKYYKSIISGMYDNYNVMII